jgi:hypothetical protein
MRSLVLLLSLVLVSCATPDFVPKAHYQGTYFPGSVSVSEDGRFVSTAATFDEDAIPTARKAAFARLLQAAENGGYQYFRIDRENTTKIIGHRFVVTGNLYESAQASDEVFPVAAIERLLNGQTLVAPQPVYRAPAPRRLSATDVRPVSNVIDAAPADEPLVIMAPTDITGSIHKADNGVTDSPTLNRDPLPASVANIPSGVVLQTN